MEEKSFCKDLGNLNSSSQGHLFYQEMVTLMEGLREAEENILECLGSGHRLLYNLAATKKLASIKKQHEEIVERLVFLFQQWWSSLKLLSKRESIEVLLFSFNGNWTFKVMLIMSDYK